MTRPFLLLLLLAIAAPLTIVNAQKPKYTINNVSLDAHRYKLLVTYDLIGINTQAPVEVTLFFHDRSYRFLRPISVTPARDEKIIPGLSRQISWDVSKDMKMLTAELTPMLIPGDPADYKFGAGPAAALLSVAVPGLGNYFVTDTREQTIKPWMKTIAVGGLLTLGSVAMRDRYRNDPYLTNDGGIWKMGEWNYKYFKNDAEYLITAGILVWLADVVQVTIKGHQNAQQRKGVMRLSAQPW